MNIVLKLVMALFFPVIFAGGYLAFDFWNVNRMARFSDGDGVTVSEYLGGWISLAGAVGASDAGAGGVPGDLAGMLPKPPAGWTVQPAVAADVDPYLQGEKDAELAAYVRAVVTEREGKGLQQVRQTYRNGERVVIVELLRYPDFIFTSFGAMQIKMELQMTGTKYRSTGFMVVRGMEIDEDLLPGDIGLRYFIGDISDQVWLRVLATRNMTDEDLLPLFETLHVPAMNARVVEKIPGMGEVPVIVLASAIDRETRAASDAERATRTAEQEAKRAEDEARIAAQAEAEKEDGGGGVTAMITGLFADDSPAAKELDRQTRQEALIEAARSGDAAAAGALAAMEFNAIAAELGKTDSNGGSSAAGGAAFGAGARGGKSTIKIGTGGCGDRAGGKFCSVSD